LIYIVIVYLLEAKSCQKAAPVVEKTSESDRAANGQRERRRRRRRREKEEIFLPSFFFSCTLSMFFNRKGNERIIGRNVL